MLQENAEQRPDRARAGAHHARQQDEQQQTAMISLGIGGQLLIGIHRLWNPTSNPLRWRATTGQEPCPPDRMLGEYHGRPNTLLGVIAAGSAQL